MPEPQSLEDLHNESYTMGVKDTLEKMLTVITDLANREFAQINQVITPDRVARKQTMARYTNSLRANIRKQLKALEK